MKVIIRMKGGKGSGFHGHSGRPGMVGGSVGQKVFHGTSVESAEFIRTHGLTTGTRATGISSKANDVFTFVTPVRAGAKYYAEGNTRIKNPAIVSMTLSGKILEIDKSVADYEAFGIVAKKFSILHGKEESYDYNEIADSLRANGYSGIQFRDRNANNRIAMAVLPEFLEM